MNVLVPLPPASTSPPVGAANQSISVPDAVLAAICATLAWGPLMRKRISRETVRGLPWYVGLWATLIGASVDAGKHEPRRFCGVPNEELLNSWSATELAYLTLIGERA